MIKCYQMYYHKINVLLYYVLLQKHGTLELLNILWLIELLAKVSIYY